MSHDLVAMVTRPLPSTTSSSNLEVDDSGIIVSSRQGQPSVPPSSSILSSPAHSTVTPPTLPVGSEVSTVSSSLVFQGFSTLWVQLLVSKLIVNIYNRQGSPPTIESSKYTTPFTSPLTTDKLAGRLSDDLSSSRRSETVKVSLEIDGISFQVDIQERCTDIIFKMASMECTYLKKHSQERDSLSRSSWLPYLSNSNGKLFSTSSSSLPEELSQLTDPLSHPLLSFESAAGVSSPHHLHHPFSPKPQPNFVQLKVKLPASQLVRTTKVSLSVKPFEVVAWLPLLDTVMEIASAATAAPISDSSADQKDAKVLYYVVSVRVCFLVLPLSLSSYVLVLFLAKHL